MTITERSFSLLIAAFFACVVSSGMWGLHRIELRARDNLRIILNGVLKAADESLRDWYRATERQALVLAQYPPVRGAALNVLNRRSDAARARLDHALLPLTSMQGYRYVLLGLDGAVLADGQRTPPGTDGLTRIGASRRDLPALRAAPQIELPFHLKEGGLDRVVMAVTAPVPGPAGYPIAILALDFDPAGEFSEELGSPWSGEQILTLAFDRQGRLLNDIKLKNELVQEGLLRPAESPILSVELRDPGGDLSRGYKPGLPRHEQPLTDMAKHATSGGSGLNLEGYRDFRGKTVVGAWRWDSKLGMGVATEIDASRAYALYDAGKRALLLMLGVVLAAALALIGQGWRQSRSIFRAIDTLRETEGTLKGEIELRNEFISVAAHELRTPLTPIRMALDLVGGLARSGTIGSFSAEKLIGLNDLAIREVERIKEVIQNYLDVATLARGHLPLNRQEIDLAELVSEVCRRFADAWSLEGERIRVTARGAVRGYWDRFRIEQVLVLLLSNALKYGEGKPIDVSVDAPDGTASFSVTNHGPTISPEEQARIFERFDKGVSDIGSRGLGVGLYVARRIVEDHGGSVRVRSGAAPGTCFIVTLPRTSGALRRVKSA